MISPPFIWPEIWYVAVPTRIQRTSISKDPEDLLLIVPVCSMIPQIWAEEGAPQVKNALLRSLLRDSSSDELCDWAAALVERGYVNT